MMRGADGTYDVHMGELAADTDEVEAVKAVIGHLAQAGVIAPAAAPAAGTDETKANRSSMIVIPVGRCFSPALRATSHSVRGLKHRATAVESI